jgi:hypothetical protein
MKNDRDKGEGQTAAPLKTSPGTNPPKDPGKGLRQDRLKQALRENLKRRKSQARGRSEDIAAPSNRDDASPHDGGVKK